MAEYFESKVVHGFVDKLEAGIDTPNYPQLRDMNRMFFEMMEAIEKTDRGYVETGTISLRNNIADIPEVLALKRNSEEICERRDEPFGLKVCITGPYTLSSFFAFRDPQIYSRLGGVLEKIVDRNIFDNKYGSVRILTVDEPVFALVDDPQIDLGSQGRENLLSTWERIFQRARQKGAETCIHLHRTTDELFWQVDSLRIVESHVGDPLYSSEKTKDLVDSGDKVLKASICITIFDRLIESHIRSRPEDRKSLDQAEQVGEIWTEIREGKVNPEMFIEHAETMEKRLRNIVQRFGSERVPYAGSECGLTSFPTYECALECLRRVSRAARAISLPSL